MTSDWSHRRSAAFRSVFPGLRIAANSICVPTKGITPPRFDAVPLVVITSRTFPAKAKSPAAAIGGLHAPADGWWSELTRGPIAPDDCWSVGKRRAANYLGLLHLQFALTTWRSAGVLG
ncbi:hypothetical protein SAMN05421753_1313 [Planctomicrobium piriforme]|uniref:Uncharacterized protein n=1 Tax=Planctomicrobium piriforme TaxID=1576369 RepID=A0A1I3TIG4_9PLAN|nr:hypothetical protein SAMN05421753_1313 [Planctomicrobium piriforme]